MNGSIETAEDMAAYIEAGDPSLDGDGNPEVDLVTCGTCGRTWNDARITGVTPAPSGRCPFEYWHEAETENEDRSGALTVEIAGEYGIADGAIRITDDDGRELVMWDSAEWTEDPSLVYVIVNAVRTALTNPEGFPDTRPEAECAHCHRRIVYDGGAWVDPEATGDDAMWRETCDEHDTFTAEHEPYEAEGSEA